jgi:hypothetical protein
MYELDKFLRLVRETYDLTLSNDVRVNRPGEGRLKRLIFI